jgi:steroid 5-alpha reductase family enzyme
MDVILAIILMAAINVGTADRALADPTGKCGYYTNSRGQQVPRPCGDWQDGSERPRDATAKCADGTWSWSKHPNYPGTCSRHGGAVGR